MPAETVTLFASFISLCWFCSSMTAMTKYMPGVVPGGIVYVAVSVRLAPGIRLPAMRVPSRTSPRSSVPSLDQ